jgi:hypothetical protein
MKIHLKWLMIAAVCAFSTCAFTTTAAAFLYTETYDNIPGGCPSGIIIASPYGVEYDFFAARAFERLLPLGIGVFGNGDEGLYLGNNDFMPNYAYPGAPYAPADDTTYLFNGYGCGYHHGSGTDYILDIYFTHGTTAVQSIDFASVPGSNAPSSSVWVEGYLNGNPVPIWTVSTSVGPDSLTTLPLGAAAVDRLVILRSGLEGRDTWYIMDNLVFDAQGEYGSYDWVPEPYGNGSGTPEPATIAMVGMALVGLAGIVRKRLF